MKLRLWPILLAVVGMVALAVPSATHHVLQSVMWRVQFTPAR